MRTAAVVAAGTVLGTVGALRQGGLPAVVALAVAAVVVAALVKRTLDRVLFAPTDEPATRLERLLRVTLNRSAPDDPDRTTAGGDTGASGPGSPP